MLMLKWQESMLENSLPKAKGNLAVSSQNMQNVKDK